MASPSQPLKPKSDSMAGSYLLAATIIGAACAALVPFGLAPRYGNSTLTPELVQTELAPLLSSEAVLSFPDTEGFEEGAYRWSTFSAPTISVVVEPATREDVAVTVQYANKYNKPFLAKGGGHGTASTLATVQDGFQIWMRKFKQAELAKDGKSARLGAGLLVEEIMNEVDKFGKVSPTGACGCVGLGAGLGGGHGRLQGLFGLVTDNILEANVVLWNGTQVTVNENSHSDLFWGLRGAGANFGIVTDWQHRVYDPPTPTWYLASLVFEYSAQDDLYRIFEAQNAAGIPGEMAVRFFFYSWNAELNAMTITLMFDFIGTAPEAEPFLAPYLALNPVAHVIHEAVKYPDIPRTAGTGKDGLLCSTQTQWLQFPVYTRTVNATAMREAADLLNDLLTTFPGARGASTMAFEGYAVNGVRALPDDFNAFPHRASDVLVDVLLMHPEGEASHEEIIARGEAIREAVRKGEGEDFPLEAYVNYALGTESLESVYGYEPWRLEKLRGLKAQYDPHNKFGHLMPIV